jgi:hypothetical protein
LYAREKQSRSSPGRPPTLEAVPPSTLQLISPIWRGFDSGGSSDNSPNGTIASVGHSGIRNAAAVPHLDLSKLQSIMFTQQLQASPKNGRDQILWPPRVPHAPSLIQRPLPAGPTPAVGASRGSESDRRGKPKALVSTASEADTLTAHNWEDGARPKVALVVVQGMEVQNTAFGTNVVSLGGRDNLVDCAPIATPVDVTFTEECTPQHLHHTKSSVCSHRANSTPKSTDFLFAIEVHNGNIKIYICLHFLDAFLIVLTQSSLI